MKKLLIGVSVLLFAFAAVADTWTDPATGIEWTYTVKNGEATVGTDSWGERAVSKSATGAITIPSMLGGCPVTCIGEWAFNNCVILTSVTIPSSVTSIGYGAFVHCYGLTSVTIPGSVTSIGDGAFKFCVRLTSMTIPEGVTSIGELAFNNCERLTSVTIPSSVTSIGEYAFAACEALKTVYVEKGDTKRVKKMLEASEFDTSKVTFVENLGPTSGSESQAGFETAHTFNGLVYDADVMCGMIQVATARKSAKGEVKVSGFVMLEDGKKQTLKGVTAKVSGGAVPVTTKVGKTSLSLTITDDGFTGTLGDMAVASADIGEETGIISGTLKMSYFDAKTGKVKTKSIKLTGITSGGDAVGNVSLKNDVKTFEAVIE